VARLCFALVYADLSPRLPRGLWALLILPLVLDVGFAFTNDALHQMWLGFAFGDGVRPLRGAGNWLLVAYGYALTLSAFLVLAWLFVRSPLHRQPVALILTGQLLTMANFALSVGPGPSVTPTILWALAPALSSALYAYALFHYRMFDPLPVARATVIEQMREGMIVLDARQKVAGLNAAAEHLLATSFARARGRDAADMLPGWAGADDAQEGTGDTISKVVLGTGTETRHYAVHASRLSGWHSATLGRLILLHDVTEQERAQDQLVQQQRALAVLAERERLARELHDSLGQVLAYIGFQLETTRTLIANRQADAADAELARACHILQDTHADVREYILGLRTTPSPQQPFFAALRHYLDGFALNYRIGTELGVAGGLDDASFAPDPQMQLFRIIQEALSNARKHGHPNHVQVRFEVCDGQVQVTVQDDGTGFDPAQAAAGGSGHFGLQVMAERAAQLSGSLAVHSAPGQGTRIVISIPRGEA
jgi:signal transduction histidine kinase